MSCCIKIKAKNIFSNLYMHEHFTSNIHFPELNENIKNMLLKQCK